MKPCPRCGAYGTISIEPVLHAKPQGTYSIAGVQNKLVAEQKYLLACSGCGLRPEHSHLGIH
jgi:hypothetical protein